MTENRDRVERLLLSADEAAHALNIGNSKVWELIASGEIASVKIGSRRLIRREALDAFIDELEQRQGVGS